MFIHNFLWNLSLCDRQLEDLKNMNLIHIDLSQIVQFTGTLGYSHHLKKHQCCKTNTTIYMHFLLQSGSTVTVFWLISFPLIVSLWAHGITLAMNVNIWHCINYLNYYNIKIAVRLYCVLLLLYPDMFIHDIEIKEG